MVSLKGKIVTGEYVHREKPTLVTEKAKSWSTFSKGLSMIPQRQEKRRRMA
jgi:hypothetical protein